MAQRRAQRRLPPVSPPRPALPRHPRRRRPPRRGSHRPGPAQPPRPESSPPPGHTPPPPAPTPPPGTASGRPKDNPFVNTAGARPEVWASGLRQLWRFSFERDGQGRRDRQGNPIDVVPRIYGGEVGQDLWEMIYTIKKGGNYG